MNRREKLSTRALGQQVAQAQVSVARDAAAIQVSIDTAVSGDLIAQSPALAAKISAIENRLDNIEEL